VEAQQALEQQLLELHEAIEVSAQASRELKYQIDTLPHVIDMIFDIQLPQLSTGACYINGFRFGPILNQWVRQPRSITGSELLACSIDRSAGN